MNRLKFFLLLFCISVFLSNCASTEKIEDNKENTFLDIRVKRGDYAADGTPYYRNIFEKGKQFTKLLSIIIEDED